MSVIPANDVSETRSGTKSGQDLGVISLTALVAGSMIGAGVFSLPQNMASGAGALATLIGWIITGVGMLGLAFVFQSLAARRPELNAGPYAYARAGFGPFVGFNSAWGYWLSAWIGNVSYAVVLFGALGYFFPIFGEGNTFAALIGSTIVLWAVHFLVLAGVRQAAIVNSVVTIAKIAPVVLFIVLVGLAFQIDEFTLDLTSPALGDIVTQVKSTMLVTLWTFIGIEGASVVSARAKNRRDVSLATISGFLLCLFLYAAVTLLSYGSLTQAELAALPNPSMAGVLEHVVGTWGAVLINLALVVSVTGAFIAWTIFAAEIPNAAAGDGTLPKFFGIANANNSPASALWITNALVQIFLVIAYFRSSTYEALFLIASAAILVPYVFSGAFALKLAATGESYVPGESRARDFLFALIATVYGIWLCYAAGPQYLFMCAILYAPGIVFFVMARKENGKKVFTSIEILLAVALVIAAIAAAWLMWTGQLSPL